MKNMNIEYIKTKDIIPYDNNPRNNDEAVKYVANSIKEFGFKVPIVITEDKVIVAGHTRLKASLELGLEEVPCIIANDLTEEQIKAFRLADNKTGELSMWSWSKLEDEMKGLAEFDMTAFGFTDFDFDIDKFFDDTEDTKDTKDGETDEHEAGSPDEIIGNVVCPNCNTNVDVKGKDIV